MFDSNVRILLRTQRIMVLRVSKAYRTISTEVASVIAGLIPIHLLARERAAWHRRRYELNKTKEEIRKETIRC